MRQFRIGLTCALAIYTAILLASSVPGSILDAINLPAHETGHVLFAAAGGEIALLGGTFLQLLLPVAVAAFFTLHRDEHAASLGVWWVGQNCITIGVAMADASTMATPLVTGVDRDWHMLFSSWGVLWMAEQYGQLMRGFGVLVMLVAILWGAFEAVNMPERIRNRWPKYRHYRRR